MKLVEQEKLSVRQAAKRLSVPLSSLDNWVRAAPEIGKGQRIPTELEVELSRMRQELAEV